MSIDSFIVTSGAEGVIYGELRYIARCSCYVVHVTPHHYGVILGSLSYFQ